MTSYLDKIDHIDLAFDDHSEGRRRVKKFVIDDSKQCGEYEDLLNAENVQIYKEQTNFDKLGRTSVTVWWREKS
jgi:hypothetical protein